MASAVTERVDNPCEKSTSITIKKQPLIITSQKWHSMMQLLNRDQELKQQADEDRRYNEYLKEGSRDMTKNWVKINTAGPVDKQKHYEDRRAEAERVNKKIQEKELKSRQEQIAKAQQLIQRMKPGPRDLESAAMLSEVIKGREIQRNINQEFNEAMKEHTLREQSKDSFQKKLWIEDEKRRMAEKRRRCEECRKEVLNLCKEHERKKKDEAKRLTECERKIRELADKELKVQIERERAVLERKKEALRRNALEAMKMAEQRRQREKIEDEVEKEVISIISKGKANIEELQEKKQEEIHAAKQQIVENNAKNLADVLSKKNAIGTCKEELRLKKAIADETLKLDQKEKERIQKEKIIKAARIQAYIDEMKRQKFEQGQQMERLKWSIANRFKNEEINNQFLLQKAKERYKKMQELRDVLSDQVREKQIKEKAEKNEDDNCRFEATEDDKFFLDYAEKLIEEAKKKSRPLYPLLKAVESYKKQNGIDVETKDLPPHLISSIPIDPPIDAKPRNNGTNNKNCGKPIIKYDINELKEMNPAYRYFQRGCYYY